MIASFSSARANSIICFVSLTLKQTSQSDKLKSEIYQSYVSSYNVFSDGSFVSSELKTILNKLVEEYIKRKELEIEEGIDRYKSLLLKLASEKKLDIALTIEGLPQKDSNRNRRDLKTLEKVHLVKGQKKYTHRNEYRQYELTSKGVELVEKLSREEK